MANITLSNAPLIYLENGIATALDAAATFDGTGLASLDGFQLVVNAIAGGLPSDRIKLANSAVNALAVDGRKIIHANILVGTFTGGAGSPLVIQLNNSANGSSVQSILRSLQYENFADNLAIAGSRQIELSLQQPGQAPMATATRTLTVSGVVDAPRLYRKQSLYDARLNLLPMEAAAAPGGPWLTYQDLITVPSDVPLVGGQPFLGGTASIVQSPGGATLTSDRAAQVGLTNYDFNFSTQALDPLNTAFPTLDRNAGYVLSFVASVQEESRFNGADNDGDGVDDQAGFTAILLGEDKKGIELGFWNNLIWAQNDGSGQANPALEPDSAPVDLTRTLFTQGESVAFDTSQTYQYEIVVQGDGYKLLADSTPILSGPLRDYSAFISPTVSLPLLGNVVLPNAYKQSNFIFLGDNTVAASATVDLGSVSISTAEATPQATALNGQLQTLPSFNLQRPDGETGITNVVLTAESGSFAPIINGSLAWNVVELMGGGSRAQITGSLREINDFLHDPANLGFQPDSTFSGTINLDVAVLDGIAPSFSFPELGGPVRGGQALSLSGLVVGDSDGNGGPVEVTLGVTGGSLSLASSNGLTFGQGDGTGDAAMRFTGSLAAVNAALNGLSLKLANLGGTTVSASVKDLSGLQSGTVVSQVDLSPVTPKDFNFDYRSDIVWRNAVTGENALWGMAGTAYAGSANLPTVADGNWQIAAAADFSLDGQTDLVWRNQATGDNLVWILNGADYQDFSPLPSAGTAWEMTGAGDFNLDGKADIVWRNSQTGENYVWYMDGLNYASAAALSSVPDLNWKMLGADDFDHDGQTDLLWRNSETGQNVIWLMDGAQFRQGVELVTVAQPEWEIAGTGDYNQDGFVDILWRNYGSGDNTIWLMRETTALASADIPSVNDLNWAIVQN